MNDILLDYYNDYEIGVSLSGDFDIGDSRIQNSEAILVAEYYDWKNKADNGFEPYSKINGTFTQDAIKNMEIAAKNTIKRDGFNSSNLSVQFDGKTLTIFNNNPSLQ